MCGQLSASLGSPLAAPPFSADADDVELLAAAPECGAAEHEDQGGIDELAPRRYVRVKPARYRPGHRVVPAAAEAVHGESWWLRHSSRDGFTAAAARAVEHSRHTSEACFASRVSVGRLNE